MAAACLALALALLALTARAATRNVTVQSLCGPDKTLLYVSAINVENASAPMSHIAFLFSTVGAPGILMAHASKPIVIDVNCAALGSQLGVVAIQEPVDVTGVSIVFESIIEFEHEEEFEDKISYDGLNANEFDPTKDTIVHELFLADEEWAQPEVRVEDDYTYIFLKTKNGTINFELYNAPDTVNTLLGVLTPEATKLRMELRNYPFLRPEVSRVAFKVSVSSARSFSCPSFSYVATASDVTFTRLFTRLVATINLVDSETTPALAYIGWPPLARLQDPGPAIQAMAALYEQAKATVMGFAADIGGSPISDSAPAVVNVTRMGSSSSQVLYTAVPYSILKATLNLRFVACIKRAYVTIESPVSDYMSWDPEIGAGPPALPSVPQIAQLIALLCFGTPAALALLLGFVCLLRGSFSSERTVQSKYSRYESIVPPSRNR